MRIFYRYLILLFSTLLSRQVFLDAQVEVNVNWLPPLLGNKICVTNVSQFHYKLHFRTHCSQPKAHNDSYC